MKFIAGIFFAVAMVVLSYGWIPFVLNYIYQVFIEHRGVWAPLWINFAGYLGTMIIAFVVWVLSAGLLALKK